MQLSTRLIAFPLNQPRQILMAVLGITVLLGLPLLWLGMDNSPEHLFSDQELASFVNQQVMENFTPHNMVILGVVNHAHKQGVFNPKTLENVLTISRFASTMEAGHPSGVEIKVNAIISPDKVESIREAGLGQVRFDWLMQEAPRTTEEAQRIGDLALANPLLKDALVSGDGRALVLYFPVTGTNAGHAFSKELRQKMKTLDRGDDRFYLTGPPVLTDTIDRAMITHLPIGTVLSSLTLFGLMFLHFRKIQLPLIPLCVVFITVIAAMAMLVATGNTLHAINLSTLIIITPIALLSSIRLITECMVVYPEATNHRQALEQAMTALFTPSLHTTLTLTAAFASLAVFPVSSIKIFGIVTALSIALTWLLTFSFVPASIMLMKEGTLKGLRVSSDTNRYTTALNRFLQWSSRFATVRHWQGIGISIAILILGTTAFMFSETNNNPLQLLNKNNNARIADKVLISKLGGIHEATLVLSGPGSDLGVEEAADWLIHQLSPKLRRMPAVYASIEAEIRKQQQTTGSGSEMAEVLASSWAKQLNELPIEESLAHDMWSQAVDTLEQLRHQQQLFNQPDILSYVEGLQSYLAQQEEVGTVHSVVGIVKKIHQELFEGDPVRFTIPATANGVTQTLLTYKKSHKPEDLFSFITPDYRQTAIQIRLNSGNSKHMQRLTAHVDAYLQSNRPPMALEYTWIGPSYINLMVQNRVIGNVLKSFAAALTVAVLVMSLLFRSPLWGLLAMLPLTGTTGIIFLVTGLTGWNYNLVTTPLTFLAFALAIDFAINFLHRSRMAMTGSGTWSGTLSELFDQPARTVVSCSLVIASASTPLLFLPLPLLQTAGLFIFLSALTAGCITIWTLPAVLSILQPSLFKKERALFQEAVDKDTDRGGRDDTPASVGSADNPTAEEDQETGGEEELTRGTQ